MARIARDPLHAAAQPQLESAEGRVLSASDAELVKQLTGADEVLSTQTMKEDQMTPPKEAKVIYTLLSPAEGGEQSRGELRTANRGSPLTIGTDALHAKTTCPTIAQAFPDGGGERYDGDSR